MQANARAVDRVIPKGKGLDPKVVLSPLDAKASACEVAR